MAQKDKIEAIIRKYERIETGTWTPSQPRNIHPEQVTLHGGIAGAELGVDQFEFCEGFAARKTFAHVMAPYLMAFAKPEHKGAPHPAPWKAAHGGLGFNITIEVELAKNVRPTNFDRLNTLWWIVALLRLRSAAPIRMPVVSDIAFATVPAMEIEPNLWTLDMSPTQFLTVKDPPQTIEEADLCWVRDHFLQSARLMDEEPFNRAFQTFDGAVWAHSPGAAIVMLWASLETVFRPGRQDITRKLSAALATYLYPCKGKRGKAFQEMRKLYEARGGTAHAAKTPENEELLATFGIARRVFSRCIEERGLPDTSALLAEWKSTASADARKGA